MKENKPVRIAQIMGYMERGGVEATVMNYYRHIDRAKFQFDFIAIENSTMPQKEEIERLGGRIYLVPSYDKIQLYIAAVERILRKNKYKIVHSHLNTMSVFSLYATKKAKIPIRIAHNHSTAGNGEIKKNIMKYLLRPFAKVNATHYAACSKYAGEWLFGKKAIKKGEVTILNNAIDLNKFSFNQVVRDEVREELGIKNKFVVGHVGRFCYQKNHEFLIDIFKEVHDKEKNSILVLVGEGELMGDVKKKVYNLGLTEWVLFLGNRSDVDRLYQAMDIFVLPSRYEGLGMVAVEAQATGLKVICSNNVPIEAKISNKLFYYLLNKSIKEWSEEIIANKSQCKRCNMIQKAIETGYDIRSATNMLMNWYEYLQQNVAESRKR